MEEALNSLHLSDNRNVLLFPTETNLIPVIPSESCTSYLHKCKNNLLAEIWAFYTSKINPSFKNWRDARMTRVYFDTSSMPKVTRFYTNPDDETPMESQEMAWNLVLHLDTIYLLIPSKAGNGETSPLLMQPGKRIDDPHDAGANGYFHMLGYVKPYYSEHKAILSLQQNLSKQTLTDDMRSVLRQAASPASRTVFPFATGRSFSDTVPSNDLQRSIIQSLAHCIECIQGPPGTGKSTTIFHIIQNRLPEDHKAIVTCVQNKAIDSIAEKLCTTDMPFVVHGSPNRLGDHAKEYTSFAQALRDPEVFKVQTEYKRASAIETLLQRRMSSIIERRLPRLWLRWWERYAMERNEALKSDCDRWFNCVQTLKLQTKTARKAAEGRILDNARAHLCTMDGLASAPIPKDNMVAIIDEAGTVPEFKIPHLLSVGARAIVAIGDQKQLQPFTHNQDANTDGYFQRVVRAIKAPMLTVQYRMHPAVCGLVSSQFYDNKLQTATTIATLRTSDPENGLRWLDYTDTHAESRDREKKCNMVEVGLIELFMQLELPSLLSQGKTVAIITFYKHQFAQLMDAGKRAGFVRAEEPKPTLSRFKHPNFRIVTVDAAQGSEADVVVLSCVRCNPTGNLGFITHRNRLCVALSRARERLLIVGSRQTLTRHSLWRAVWKACARGPKINNTL